MTGSASLLCTHFQFTLHLITIAMAAEEPTNVYKNLSEVYSDRKLNFFLDHWPSDDNFETSILQISKTHVDDMPTSAKPSSTRMAPNQKYTLDPQVRKRTHHPSSHLPSLLTPPPIPFPIAGRVNLIGEHIDYEGYGVLPMAISLDTVVALRRDGNTISLANLMSDAYPPVEFPIDPSQEVNVGKHNWGNYFLGAYKGVFEHLQSPSSTAPTTAPTPTGLQVMVHGRVPTGGGLSSSAAIVCASSLAILHAHGITLTKGEVAEFSAKAERYVGVTSGGMDQAISIMGRQGIAQHVEFNPVRATEVVLPEEACFVIANSLTVSNKAEGAEGRYNLRVVECRLASAVLAVLLGQGREEAVLRRCTTLHHVEALVLAQDDYSASKNPALDAVHALLHEEPYDRAEIEGILGIKNIAASTLFEGDASAGRVLAKFSTFKLRQRAAHVYSEKQRVLDFASVTRNSELKSQEKLHTLATLMDASQTSCRDLYECSSPELDALVACAKSAGALGSRLTGAGWGGCTVSLLKKENVGAFIDAVKKEYYAPLIAQGRLREEKLGDTIFASAPASGGGVVLSIASH